MAEGTEETKETKYGIYDTKDHVWLGDDSGPKVFDNYLLARVAAQVIEKQVFGSDLGCRYRAREIPSGIWRKRDEVPTKMTTLEALIRLENQRDDTPREPIIVRLSDLQEE